MADEFTTPDEPVGWLVTRFAAVTAVPAAALQAVTGRAAAFNAYLLLAASVVLDVVGVANAPNGTSTPTNVAVAVVLWVAAVVWIERRLRAADEAVDGTAVLPAGAAKLTVLVLLLAPTELAYIAEAFSVSAVAGLAEAWELAADLLILGVLWNRLPGGTTVWSRIAGKVRAAAAAPATTTSR